MADHAPGYITSSTVRKLLTGEGDSLIKGGRDFARKIARERFGVIDEESSFDGNYATEWGNTYEYRAIERYEQETFTEVHSMQKGVTAKLEDNKIYKTDDAEGWLSCTPDGYVGDNGLTEVKCHYNTDKHMMNLLNNAWVKSYEQQCRFQMMLTDRKYCDLISYDPRWQKPLDLHVVRLERDPEWDEFFKDRISQAEEIIDETLDKIEEVRKEKL